MNKIQLNVNGEIKEIESKDIKVKQKVLKNLLFSLKNIKDFDIKANDNVADLVKKFVEIYIDELEPIILYNFDITEDELGEVDLFEYFDVLVEIVKAVVIKLSNMIAAIGLK